MIRPIRTGVGLCGMMAALLLLITATGASAAEALPAWHVVSVPYPSQFQPGSAGEVNPGPGYAITATNVGSAPTGGTYTITDSLPSGLTFVSGQVLAKTQRGEPLSCTAVARSLACHGEAVVFPGEWILVKAAVSVSSTSTGELRNRAGASGGGTRSSVLAFTPTEVAAGEPAFEFLRGAAGLSHVAGGAAGQAASQAGSHPYQLSIGTGLSSQYVAENRNFLVPSGGLRDMRVDLPQGEVVNPTAASLCTEAELESDLEGGGCPDASQVGTVTVLTSLAQGVYPQSAPLYNMVAPPGHAAELAFDAVGQGVYVHLMGGVRSDGDYGLYAGSTDILAKVPILGVGVELWGDPSAAEHDHVRGECGLEEIGTCPVERTNKALLTTPSACSGPLTTTASADAWIDSGVVGASAETTDPSGEPVGIEGCGALPFEPRMSVRPEVTSADSPTGMAVDLHVPQNEEYTDGATGEPRLAEANLKDTTVTLPPGLVVNPSGANGLAACSPAQIGLTTAVGQSPPRFTDAAPTCPDGSKLGTVELNTPLLDHPLPGAIYLAAQGENPFGSLLALYVVVDDPRSGVVIKLPGKIEADGETGRLSASFAENPELPFEDLKLGFWGGAAAPLRTPSVCGTSATEASLTPWSGTAPVASPSPYAVGSGAGGAPCATSESQLPNQPAFQAGTVDPLAGTYSPFVLHLSRADGSQQLRALDVTLPKGLTGRIAGLEECPEGAIAAAAAKSGAAELASPSCPAASEVGTVDVAAGAGPAPYHVQGRAYLAGPYKGAPLSLVIFTPAVAGPFDFGTVVVRSALYVDPRTAQITVKSDPIPTILDGIPLDVRSISVELTRSQFTLNPTSCEASAVSAQAISTTGAAAVLSNRFQVGGCGRLKFKPKLKLSLKGATGRTGHPALKAVLTFPKKGAQANVARAQVGLPHSEFLDQGNLNKVCTQPELQAATCPASSIYGHAKAWTPLLAKPLEGPVYLGVGFGYKLPALVADLNGQIRILLVGRVDTNRRKGIRNTFEVVPDAPVSRFVLTMKGGKKYGLLENSEDICRRTQKASVRLIGQNGKAEQLHPVIANGCGKGARRHHGKSSEHKHHRQRGGKR